MFPPSTVTTAAVLFEHIVFGAPVLAPLLFPNLALLAFTGLSTLRESP